MKGLNTSHVLSRSAQAGWLAAGMILSASAFGGGHSASAVDTVCEGFGPQTPRDIDNAGGNNNPLDAVFAPPAESLNLCNIHFHNQAEHKAAEFSVYAGPGDGGHGGGYKCGIGERLTAAELAAPEGDICGGLQPGDTIEVHWVHSTCDLTPGPTLGACIPDGCENPQFRVETQVFTLVNDVAALDFSSFDYDRASGNAGLHQALSLPQGTGQPVQFLGSTTGPNYSEQVCSPILATWSVRPQCAKVDINSVGKWCESNDFDERKAHGVRALVTHPDLLSTIGE